MNRLTLFFLLLTACALLAQSPVVPSSASVTFEQRWPGADPQWFELTLHPDGSSKYRSLPHQDTKSDPGDPAPDPYELSFMLSPRSVRSVFAAAPGLLRFQGTLDKTKVAFTGTKTLRYDDGSAVSSVISYNYSSSPELNGLTSLMLNISGSIQLSQTLQLQLRFDKLALDSTLRGAEEIASVRPFQEPQLLEPILQRIASDPAVMNIARQRARHILRAASNARQP
jgi:hypothetical protein